PLRHHTLLSPAPADQPTPLTTIPPAKYLLSEGILRRIIPRWSPQGGLWCCHYEHRGYRCDGRAGLFMCSSPIVSEAKALLEAVTFASNSQCSCTIFSDCFTLMNNIKAQKHKWPWECYGLIGRITDILGSSPNISIRFIPRKENIFAD
ncbi:hypothetical protein LINPERHAP1_LOCUS30341, partial [Linum perenne]